jgi:hypothetical protein
MDATPLTIAHAWIDAVNCVDAERLERLSSSDIEIRGPRGSVRGTEVLRDWLARAGARFENRRVFERGETVVVEQRGTWRSVETGDVIGATTVASLFKVQNSRVVAYERFDDLGTALAAAGLDESDEQLRC